MKPYNSRGTRICQSTHHEHLFIVNHSDGTFHTLTSSEQQIRQAHPEDNSKFEPQHREFNHTSNYKPQAVGFQSFQKLARSHAKQSKS